MLACRAFVPRLPGPLFAVVGAIAASAAFDFAAARHRRHRAGAGGLPRLGLPEVELGETCGPLLPVAASCFLMIVAQSAATARVYAARHRETLDENADLVGLSAANAAAALSGTFVVNGSPTQTAMVESSGGRSQIAHLATAAVVALVLLFLTGPLQYLPRCVLGAIVFTIAVGLVDVRGLRDIRRESPGEFRLALVTAAVVVLIGVEQGILLAMVLSLLRHVRHSYRPHTAVLVERRRRPVAADPRRAGRAERAGPGGLSVRRRPLLCQCRPLRGGRARPRRRSTHAGALAGGRRGRDHQTSTTRPRGCCGTCSRTWCARRRAGARPREASLRADLDRHRLSDVIGRSTSSTRCTKRSRK